MVVGPDGESEERKGQTKKFGAVLCIAFPFKKG
jgi:hypothetical protein